MSFSFAPTFVKVGIGHVCVKYLNQILSFFTMTIYYIDTLIWRDYHEARSDRFRPIGEWAFRFIKKAIDNQDTLLYSDHVVDELRKDYDEKRILDVLSIASEAGILKHVEIDKVHILEAIKLKKKHNVPFGDALHAILSKDNGAVLITRNHHYEELQYLVDCKKPEDLI